MMFEKEAEKYVKAFTDRSHIWSNDKLMQLQLREAYKDGAEYGYNKANEWHFDEVPDNENDILCQIAEDESVVGYYSESKKRYYTIDGQNIDVIAWKEIVLPKLPKED